MKQDDSVRWRNLVAAFSAIVVFGFTFGMTFPLLSLLLEDRGVGPDMIGINSAMMPIGILLFSSIIPVASKRFGTRNLALVAAFVTAVLVICFKVFDNLAAWFLIRLVTGMSISTLFVLSEAWIVRFAGDEHRGKIVALYASVLSISFGTGPAIISWIGIHGWTPFVLGAVILLIGMIPLTMIRDNEAGPPEETETSGIFSFAGKAPMLLMAVAVFAIFDSATLSLFPVYGLRSGMDVSMASLALTALIFGNVVLQFPIGWLADRFSKRLVIGGCAFTAALLAALLPFVMGSPVMWPIIVLMGAAGYGVYTVSLASLGDRFQGPELVTGSAAFAVMWGVGALVGGISGGWAMAFSHHGLMVLLAAVYLLLMVGMVLRSRQAAR